MTKATSKVSGAADATLANDAALAAQIANSLINSEREKEHAIEVARTMGEMAAEGGAQLTDLLFYFNTQVRAKALREEHAEVLYLGYATAFNERGAKRGFGNAKILPADAKSAKSSVSAFRTAGKKWAVAQGAAWFERVATVRAHMPEEIRKSEYASYVSACRKVNEKFVEAEKAGQDTDAVVVTDQDIVAMIAKNSPAPKSDIEKMRDLIGKLAKFAEGDYGALEPALPALRDIVTHYEKFGLVGPSTLIEGKREAAE